MRKPRVLRPGDQIAVVAPASFSRASSSTPASLNRASSRYEDSVFERICRRIGGNTGAACATWRDPIAASSLCGGYGACLPPCR